MTSLLSTCGPCRTKPVIAQRTSRWAFQSGHSSDPASGKHLEARLSGTVSTHWAECHTRTSTTARRRLIKDAA